ncbi:MAG TPA: hypothetical protein ENG33_09275, partial [Chloroflexi bacterium]|nr:hypothetical protein [Chloroflexota bacterium]
TASPYSVKADGASASTIVASVKDALGNPAPDGTVVVFTTTLGLFPGGITHTLYPTGTDLVEAESGEVTKASSWIAYSDPSASGGGGVRSNTAGDRLIWVFTGTAVSALFQNQPDGGIAWAFVDGHLYAEIDTYSPVTQYQQLVTITTGLPFVSHTLEIEVTGRKNPAASDAYVTADAFKACNVNRNNACLTAGGLATTSITSTVEGTATITACADGACGTAQVNFTPPPHYVYLPLILKTTVEACQELVENGGFETDAAWIIGPTLRPARYVTDTVHSGSRSVLLGIKPGEADSLTYSSIRQLITLPASSNITLTFWYYPISQGDVGDHQEALLLDENGAILEVLWRDNENDGVWKSRSFDLTGYAEQKVYVYFNVLNDGDGIGVAAMYVDDVSVQACPIPGPTPTPTPPPIPTPTPTPGPVPSPTPGPPGCYPWYKASAPTGDGPHGVAFNTDANEVYVANHLASSLTVFDASTYGVITTVVGGGLNYPNGVAYNPANGKIYVANDWGNSVSVFDAATHAWLKTIPVGSMPDGVAVDPDLNRIYLANYGDDTVSIIDGATDMVTETVAVGDEPAMIAVNPVTHKAYVALHGAGHIAVIYPDMTVKDVDIYSAGPYGIAVDPIRNLVYVATIDTYRIVAVDGDTDEFLGWAEILREWDATPAPLRQIAVNPYIGTSGHIYVTTASTDGPFDKVLMIPKGWDEYFARPYALDMGVNSDPREGIAFDLSRYLVYVTLRGSDRLAVIEDGEPTCFQNFSLGLSKLTRGEYYLRICVFEDGRCRWIVK